MAVDRSERGSGSMIMIGVMLVVTTVALAGICIAGYLVAAHRVRSAADLAALSGASAVSRGEEGCRAARSNARANGVTVASCAQVGDEVDFVVTVEAQLAVALRLPGLPSTVAATAHAGSRS